MSYFDKPTEGKTKPELIASMDDNTGVRNSSVETIEIHKAFLFPDPTQPRKWFSPTVIERRKKQMERDGQESAITVLPGVLGDDGVMAYQIVDGECRWRAVSTSEKLNYLRAEIWQGDPQDSYRLLISQLVHNNDGSEKLTPVERAAAYQRLIDKKIALGVDNPQEQVANDIGMDKGEFSRLISLNNMPDSVEDFALSAGIGDTKVLNGIVRVAKIVTKEELASLFSNIKNNEVLRASGGEAQKMREIVQNAVKEAKGSAKVGNSKSKKNKPKIKDKKQRLLAAQNITIQLQDSGGILIIETPREIIKIKLSEVQMRTLQQ